MIRRLALVIYLVSLSIIAIVLFIVSVNELEHYRISIIDILFWTVFVVWAELASIKLPKGGAALSVGGVVDCSIIVLFPTPIAALYGVLSGIVTSVKRKVDLERFVFNISMFAVTMSVSSLIINIANVKLYEVGPNITSDISSVPNLIIPILAPFICSIIVYFIINTGLVSIAIGISENESPIYIWKTNYKWTIPSIAAMGPIGLVIALVYYLLSSINPILAIIGVSVFFLPTLLMRYAHKLFVDVNNAYFNSIKALVSALDASHHYTQGHSTRVSRNAEIVSKHLKLPEKDIESISQGALLHDIGKIGLDKSILDKDGALSNSEWDQVKQHPVLGARIIHDLTFLEEAKQVVLHHHERIDGKGYPYGLIGDDIPLGAKIVNALDSLDALTSDRAYRHALTVEQALDILQTGAGEQFDRTIVKTVTELVESGQLVFQSEVEDDDLEPEVILTLRDVKEALNTETEGSPV